MSWVFGIVPLAALVAEVVLCVRYSRTRADFGDPVSRGTYVWIAPSAIVLAFLAVWGFSGLVDSDGLWYMGPLCCTGIVASGLLSLHRDELRRLYDGCDDRTSKKLRVGIVISLLVLCLFATEAPFNHLIPFGGPSYFWLEMLLEGLLLLACYLLAQRRAAACALPVTLFLLIGIAQYFIRRFKNAAILPTDLFALGTAAAVSSEYVFALDDHAMLGMACAVAALAILSLVRTPMQHTTGAKAHPVVRNLVGGMSSLTLLVALALVPNYMEHLGVGMEYWYSIDYYQMQGILPTFLAVLQDMPIRKPEGYSTERAEQLMQEHAQAYRAAVAADANLSKTFKQFEELKPSVVVVMDESFADLARYDGMHAGYTGPQFLKEELTDALSCGELNVSVLGGGTCNSEFEFLTGNSMSFIGSGKYPYSVYDLSNIDALAADFKQLGYETSAIHPNYPSNWKRDTIYPQFGFDTFLSIDDFGGMPDCSVDKVTPNEPHAEVFHSGVSDAATYERILEQLRKSEAPQFFFDVTMANHGSYVQNNIDAAYVDTYHPADYEGEHTDAELSEYLACVKRSDEDLRDFLAELRKLDRPVVVVFFGDHQPSIAKDYNDVWYPNEDEDQHARRVHSSDYVIWANYDVDGQAQTSTRSDTSVDMLGAKLLGLIGAPLTDYQAAVLDIMRQIPSLSITGYQDAKGAWHKPEDDSPSAQAYHDLQLIEYLNFATKV